MRTCSSVINGLAGFDRAPTAPRIAARTDEVAITRLATLDSIKGMRMASAVGRSTASTILAAISGTGKPSPARHSTTNGVRTYGFVHSACGQSWMSTTGMPSLSAWRTTSSSAGLGSPAITRTTAELPATGAESDASTAPGGASSRSWRASCSASIPLTSTGPTGEVSRSLRNASATRRTSPRTAGGALTAPTCRLRSPWRGCPGERR